MSWDTSGLFGTLLDTFTEALREADNTATASAAAEGIRLARIGFSRSAPPDRWSVDHEAIIAIRLGGELSQPEMDWYGEAADAVSAFACYSLGALLGKQAASQVDAGGWMLGDAHLPAFLALENERISAEYARARRERQVDGRATGRKHRSDPFTAREDASRVSSQPT